MRSPTRRQPPAFLRLFCSIWFGVILLTLILAYASIFSALPPIRGALELTEMAAFRHWVFTTLIVLFTITLSTVTIVRIKWSVINLGVLMVHTGLIMLVLSSTWYFYTKVEGDTLLVSPRIEILGPDQGVLPGGRILPDAGQQWATVMPVLGGNVSLEVAEVSAPDQPENMSAMVRFKDDRGESEVRLRVDETASLNQSLSARLVKSKPMTHFYDNDQPALVARQVSNDPNAPANEWQQFPIHGLPLFRERFLNAGYQITDRTGKIVESKRTQARIPGTRISTAWFESWRMPIALETADLPFDVRVTGYLPYVAGTRTQITPGGNKINPGLRIHLQAGESGLSEWMLAEDPLRSLWPLATPIEFVWATDAQDWDAHLTPLAGPHELTIEVVEPPISMTVAITQGQEIKIPGTTYTLSVAELIPDWPLITPGYEKARSPTVLIDVSSDSKRFTRTVIQRFPHLSQDTDDTGVRHREALYDSNLLLSYRATPNGWIKIVAGPDKEPVAAIFDAEGGVQKQLMPIGEAKMLTIGTSSVATRLLATEEKMVVQDVPVTEPLETRRPNMGRMASAIRYEFTGRGALSGWSETQWCVFSPYTTQDARPIVVSPTDSDQSWEILYSRLTRPLGATLIPQKLSVSMFPGRQSVESWRSDFFVVHEGQTPKPAEVYTNQTYVVDNWTLFQSGAAEDHWSYTILGVGNRQGIMLMVLACTLITVGCLYAFYVKPILIRRLQVRSARAAGSRQAQAMAARTQNVANPELVEARS